MLRRRIALLLVSALLAGCNVPAGGSPTELTTATKVPTTEAPSTETTTAVATPTNPPPTPDLTAEPLLWFGPLPVMPTSDGRPYTGSTDFMALFEQGAPWEQAAAGLHVFKLYGEWVAYNASEAELARAVEAIRARGLALAVEAGPLNASDECGQGIEGFAGLEEGATIARRLQAAGAQLDFIALDEPYYFAHVYDGPNACHWDPARIASGVDDYIQFMKGEFPEVIVGDTEPFSGPTTPEEYRDWLLTFRREAGYDLAFLHMDFDWSRANGSQEALTMQVYGQELGIPIGAIYLGNAFDPDDATWAAVTGERIKRHQLEDGGAPDHVLFQSWLDKPDRVLPESDPTTFTGLIKTYLQAPETLGYGSEGSGANLALGTAVRASAAIADFPASHAVDGDAATWWSAGGGPPQWIEIDLGQAHEIGELQLVPSQSPAGPTSHRVLGSGPATGGEFRLLHTFAGQTRDGETLSVIPETPWSGIHRLRIVSDSSPSWVAWREIIVLAP